MTIFQTMPRDTRTLKYPSIYRLRRVGRPASNCCVLGVSLLTTRFPETNFYFRYGISQAPVGHKYLFFRITINGRQVVSWGVDLSETTAGAAHQALFEPSTYYQHNDNGVVMTEYGIESRCFRFVSYGSREASIADDGGLIEVQVFRAKARNRRSPQPDQYRGGDKYGIA